MKIVMLGATSGMGRAIARRFAERGETLFLLGHEPDELERSAADLSARAPDFRGNVGHAHCDLREPEGFKMALCVAEKALGGIDTVIVTAAVFASQDQLEADIDRTEELLRINFTNTVVFCEHARNTLLESGGGTLCVFSSVAGDRGRKPVALYGAAKSGLSTYLEALDHRYRSEGLNTICVKPGFVKTGMTAGLKPPPFAGEPEQVAALVVRAIDRGTPMVYAPSIWRLIMLVIMHLPRFIMRRIGF